MKKALFSRLSQISLFIQVSKTRVKDTSKTRANAFIKVAQKNRRNLYTSLLYPGFPDDIIYLLKFGGFFF
jgi:hypothetical protein